MCVLELELLSGAVEMAFIVAPIQFNFGIASAFTCKGFLCSLTFNLLLLVYEKLSIFSS